MAQYTRNERQAVIDEKADIDSRLSQLNKYKYRGVFENLSYDEQERLNTQGHFMCAYSAILGARIEAFQLIDTPKARGELNN